MQQGIHPDYHAVQVTCSCGNTFVTRSTAKSVNRITFGIIAEGRTLSHLFAERFLAGGKTVPANARREWWGVTGLNRGPADYESDALTD